MIEILLGIVESSYIGRQWKYWFYQRLSYFYLKLSNQVWIHHFKSYAQVANQQMTYMQMRHISPDQLTGNDRLEWWERRPWEIPSVGHLQMSIGQSLHLPETTLPEHRPISYLLIAPAKILTSRIRNLREITSIQNFNNARDGSVWWLSLLCEEQDSRLQAMSTLSKEQLQMRKPPLSQQICEHDKTIQFYKILKSIDCQQNKNIIIGAITI